GQVSSNGVFLGKASGATVLIVRKERSVSERVGDSGVLLLQDLVRTPLDSTLKLLRGRNIVKLERESSMTLDELFIRHLSRDASSKRIEKIILFLHDCAHFCPRTLGLALTNERNLTVLPLLLDM
ncbi:hypothetical protein ADUPG1_005330, partial [Aduncisulcus paluster]